MFLEVLILSNKSEGACKGGIPYKSFGTRKPAERKLSFSGEDENSHLSRSSSSSSLATSRRSPTWTLPVFSCVLLILPLFNATTSSSCLRLSTLLEEYQVIFLHKVVASSQLCRYLFKLHKPARHSISLRQTFTISTRITDVEYPS